MKKNSVIVFYLLFVTLLILGIFFDGAIVKFFAENRIEFLIILMKIFSYTGTWIFLIFILLFLFLLKNKRKFIFPLLLSITISYALTYLLKTIIDRERPIYALLEPTSASFPSGHSAFIFSALPILFLAFPKQKIIFIIIAILVAFSRLYLGMHYLTDVIFGAMLGFGVGLIVRKFIF